MSEHDDLAAYTAIEARLAALAESLRAADKKLDAIHISLEKDISEVKGQILEDGKKISKAELRLAQLQGAGAALTLGLPFIAVVLNHVLGGN